MRRFFVALIAALVLGLAVPVAAEHDDPIPDPIPLSDLRIDLEPIGGGFTTPLLGVSAPGNSRQLHVVDQVGTITAIPTEPGRPGAPDAVTFLDVGPTGLDLLVPLGAFGPGSFDERGLLGLAFHPDYDDNGLVYTYTSEPLGPTPDFTTLADDEPRAGNASLSVIREWQVAEPDSLEASVDPTSSRVVLRVEQPQFNHNGGDIAFGPDGLLHIALGDGGGADDQGPGHAPGGNGQDLSAGNVLGKILRIDPAGSDSANGAYGIPADNPFVGTDAADEIYAYGFRNPFRLSFDRLSGVLIAADVGQNDIEEVNLVQAGGNYGWPVKEGTFLFDNGGDGPGFTTADSPGSPPGLIDPVAQYDHDEGVSVTGGFVYRGEGIRQLRGSYVFGDLTQGFASGPAGRLLQIDRRSGELRELFPASGPVGLFITGFGQDTRVRSTSWVRRE